MQVITSSQALDKVIHSLGLNSKATPSLLKTQIIADYLRHTLLTLSHSATTVQPVFVTTLLNQVQRQLTPLWPDLFQQQGEEEKKPVRRVLEQLEQIREVADLGKGYWLPTPLRLIRLPSSQILLIGGMDTKTLQSHFGNRVYASTGLARRINTTDEAMCLVKEGIEWQRFEDWLGEETETDLRSWTTHLLEKAKKRLKSSGSEITEFDIYAPNLCKTHLQNFRWVPAKRLSAAPKEMVLCRLKNGYYLGQLKSEKSVYLASEIRLNQLDQNVELCKLLYGLDMLYDRPTRVEFEQCNDNEDKLIFRNWLPTSQRRLLLAVGHEVHEKLPVVYQFSRIYKEDIFQHIQKLGIQMPSNNAF